MATFRLSKALVKSNAPSSFRLSSVQVLDSEPVPAASFRLAGVQVPNAPSKQLWLMSGGVWFARTLHYRQNGAWV